MLLRCFHSLDGSVLLRSGELVNREQPNTPLKIFSGRALALAVLGWAFVRVIAKLLFTRQPPGLQQFHANYGSEGLSAIDLDEREALQRFSRCMACGLCDVGEAERMRKSNGAYPGLMQLVLASTRSMPDYDAAARGFDHVSLEVLQRKRTECPVDIPFDELARFVRRRAESAPPSLPRP